MSGQLCYKSVDVPSSRSWCTKEIGVEISSIHCLQAYIQCTSDLASAILDLSLSVIPDITDRMDDMSSELKVLGNMKVAIGILTIYSLEAEIHEPALKIDC